MADKQERIAMKLFLTLLLVSSCAWASDVTRGNQVDAIVRDTTPLYEDSEVCARVNEIGQKVVAASGNPSAYSFRFYVLNSPDATTFSAPGGPVYITTGLLSHLKSEDELAAILGHEIAHVNERHLMRIESSERSKVFWGRVLIVGIDAAAIFGSAALQAEAARGSTVVIPGGSSATSTTTIRGSNQIVTTTTYRFNYYEYRLPNPSGAQFANLNTGAVSWGTAGGGSTVLDLYYQGYKDEYEFTADRLAVEYAKKAGYDGSALARALDRLSGPNTEIDPAEISHMHSSIEKLAVRASKAREQGNTPSPQKP
jgi:predicted Zn-dependent protease